MSCGSCGTSAADEPLEEIDGGVLREPCHGELFGRGPAIDEYDLMTDRQLLD